MKIAAFTMVYNESVNLPIWRRYYGSLFGENSIYALDHGSNDGSTDSFTRNRILIPREAYDNEQRAKLVSRFHSTLLTYYDVVIYTDCDEFIIANPDKYRNLRDYVERMSGDYVTTIGLNVMHDITGEPSMDWNAGILKQRKYAVFPTAMCKPLISRKPMQWDVGFHASTYPPNFDPDLYLFHLKTSDMNSNLKRQGITRNLPWKDERFGAHQRLSDDALKNSFHAYSARPKKSDPEFAFAEERKKFCETTVLRQNGFYAPAEYFESEGLVEIPERFKNVL